MRARTWLVAATLLASWSQTARAQDRTFSASKQDPEAAPESGIARGTVDRLLVMSRLEVGYRGSYVTDSGYNPFSTRDYFDQTSIGLSRTVFAHGRFTFAPGILWDYGRAGASARGDLTSFEMHRLSVPLEGRMHFRSWGYAFLRAAPGAALENVEVDDPSSPAALRKSRWLFSTDVSAGYAFPVFPRVDAYALTARAWIQTDIGYGAVVAQRLDLTPDLPSGDPRLASGIDLGSIAMHGVFFRLAASVSF